MLDRTTAPSRDNRLAKRNARNVMGGMALLRQIPKRTARVAFFDPQYRGLLDEMGYGNEGDGRERRRASLPAMSEDTITVFVEELCRVLKPSGYMFLWVDKFAIGSAQHLRYLRRAPLLNVVDLIAWNKERIGMGRRSRCTTEYLVVAQKHPTAAGDTWTDHGIPDSFGEKVDRSVHPHAKPRVLTEKLVRATTRKGDLVVDPCAGSYVVLDACRAADRDFLGCDLISS